MVKIFGYPFFEKSAPISPPASSTPPSANTSTLQSLEEEDKSWSGCIISLLAPLMNLGLRIVDFFYALFCCRTQEEEKTAIARVSSLPPLAKDEITDISEMLRIFGNCNRATILGRRSELEGMRARTMPIHPFQSMVFILNNPTCKEDLIKIRTFYKDTIPRSLSPWHRYVDGIRKKMEFQLGKSNVWSHLDAFAKGIGRDPKQMRILIEKAKKDSNWDSFINYLIDK